MNQEFATVAEKSWRKNNHQSQNQFQYHAEIPEQQIPEFISTSPESEERDSESQHIDTREAVASLNVCLVKLGETPYSQVKGRGK